ncbi:hypothetical protein [Legionella drancourtii]|uniref:Uncharacterized protein n=1 Tax=Legionella drancourtii LLAP12 TaxID=658187 RepID=G9ETP5_9GAMM|nr:hypothetical protein [Legionella drancourtii]EHL29246.1 hypothetical protein LDG_8680 [Legionella drancourtii LLAP12]
MPADTPTTETSVSLNTTAPQPTQESAPTSTPTPTPAPEENVANDKKEEAKKPQQQQPLEQLQQPKPNGGKEKKKDPMMEMMDDFENFVKETNKQLTDFITGFVKDKGNAAWDSLKNTQPMKTLKGALDEGKQFINDKIDQKMDSVSNSAAVTAVKSAINGMKDKITNSFSDVMNSAANSIANAVHKATTPSPKNAGPSNDEEGQLANDAQATALPSETAQADTGAQLSQSADTVSANTSDMANTFGGDGSLDENDAAVSSTPKPTVGADEAETATEGIRNAI